MLPQSLQKSIDSIAAKEGYNSYEVHHKTITDSGNYIAEVYEVDIKGKTVDEVKETNLYVKKAIPDDKLKGHFAINDAFAAECYFYKELSKIYDEMQEAANIPVEDRFKTIKGYEESSVEAIILDNVTRKGFNTYHRMDLISREFAQLSVQQLATFHGLSFVLQNRRPGYFDEKIKPMKIPYGWNEEGKAITLSLLNGTVNNIEDGETKTKAEKFVPIALDKNEQYFKTDTTGVRCLCHGDFRPNSILKKENDGKVSDVVVVDYQILHYGCPVNDLVYFLFFGTDRQFRKHYLTKLKDLYYDTLTRFLNHFNLNVYQIFPRDEFEKVFKEKLDYGLVTAMVFGPIDFAPEGAAIDFADDTIQDFNAKLDNKFQERLKGIIDDFVEWGYL